MNETNTTEKKIKEAAKQLFLQKGYKGVSSRQIAELAGSNTALLNYYFRSKEQLYSIIRSESVQEILATAILLFNDTKTSLSEKIESFVNRYIDIMLANPHLPLFVFSEIQANPDRFISRIGLDAAHFRDSVLFRQMQEQIESAKLSMSPEQIWVNLISFTLLPIIGRVMIKAVMNMTDSDFLNFIEVRRQLIPQWIKGQLGMKSQENEIMSAEPSK
jgi:AcrR family transcriptional regulator